MLSGTHVGGRLSLVEAPYQLTVRRSSVHVRGSVSAP